MNKNYILLFILAASIVYAADSNHLIAPNISSKMSLRTLKILDSEADSIKSRTTTALLERQQKLLSQPVSEISLEELEIMAQDLAQEQYSKTEQNELACCAALATTATGAALVCAALNDNIPEIDSNLLCLNFGVAAVLRGLHSAAQNIMQPTMKHKIEEIQQAIREKQKKSQ